MPKAYNILPNAKTFVWGNDTVISCGNTYKPGGYEEIISIDNCSNLIELSKSKRGKYKIIESYKAEGYIAKISTFTEMANNAYGTVYADIEVVDVIVKGWATLGRTGKLGTYYEFILSIPDNTFITVKNTDDVDLQILYFGKDKVYTIKIYELKKFCNERGINIPDIFEFTNLARVIITEANNGCV